MARTFDVADVSEIPPGQGRAFAVGGRMIAIFEQQGSFRAIDDFCPHMGASLADGWIEDGCVTCPWHAWRFQLSDGGWLDNPKIRATVYRAWQEGQRVLVELPDEANAS